MHWSGLLANAYVFLVRLRSQFNGSFSSFWQPAITQLLKVLTVFECSVKYVYIHSREKVYFELNACMVLICLNTV